jgi:hypothetical protein
VITSSRVRRLVSCDIRLVLKSEAIITAIDSNLILCIALFYS